MRYQICVLSIQQAFKSEKEGESKYVFDDERKAFPNIIIKFVMFSKGMWGKHTHTHKRCIEHLGTHSKNRNMVKSE